MKMGAVYPRWSCSGYHKNAFPVGYAANGKQCIVITTGGGGPTDATYSAFTPENERAASATIMFAFCER